LNNVFHIRIIIIRHFLPCGVEKSAEPSPYSLPNSSVYIVRNLSIETYN